MTTPISGLNSLPVVKVQSGNMIPLVINFQTANSYTVDLTTVYANQTFGRMSAVFIDNSTNPNPVVGVISGSNQTFEAPAYSNGMYPIAATALSTLTLTSTGGASANNNIQIYDYNIPSFVWISPPAGTGATSVSIADGQDVTQGSKADAIATTPFTNPWSIVSLLKGILNTLSLAQQVVGNVVAGSADSGNSVKGGAVFNTSLPVYTAGNRTDFQAESTGELRVSIAGITNGGVDAYANGSVIWAGGYGNATRGRGPLLAAPMVFNGTTWDRRYSGGGSAAAGGGIGAAACEEAGRTYSNIITATTTVVKSGKGNLHTITVNTPVSAATIKLYDNTAGSGTLIATITCPSSLTPFNIVYDVAFATGLTIVTSGATDVTVAYR
jgi:hypothetical protein